MVAFERTKKNLVKLKVFAARDGKHRRKSSLVKEAREASISIDREPEINLPTLPQIRRSLVPNF